MNKKKNNSLAVVILASGSSERFGKTATPKQYKKINKKTILEYSIDKFSLKTIVKSIVYM